MHLDRKTLPAILALVIALLSSSPRPWEKNKGSPYSYEVEVIGEVPMQISQPSRTPFTWPCIELTCFLRGQLVCSWPAPWPWGSRMTWLWAWQYQGQGRDVPQNALLTRSSFSQGVNSNPVFQGWAVSVCPFFRKSTNKSIHTHGTAQEAVGQRGEKHGPWSWLAVLNPASLPLTSSVTLGKLFGYSWVLVSLSIKRGKRIVIFLIRLMWKWDLIRSRYIQCLKHSEHFTKGCYHRWWS